MKNKLVIIAGIAAVMAVTTAQASMIINGNIGFSGNAVLNTGTAATATKVLSYSSTTVLSDSGTLAVLAPAGTAINFVSPWTFFPGANVAITPFWTSSLANGLTFSLTSWTAVRGVDGFGNANVAIGGVGFISDTQGDIGNNYTFAVTLQDPASNPGISEFTFSASQAPAPDGGTTAMLLGIALSGVALLKKKLTA